MKETFFFDIELDSVSLMSETLRTLVNAHSRTAVGVPGKLRYILSDGDLAVKFYECLESQMIPFDSYFRSGNGIMENFTTTN